MSDYKVVKLNNKPYDFLIIATSVNSPLDNLSEIANQIDDNIAGVLFDLTLINGLNSNRYIGGELKEGCFKLSSFVVVPEVSTEISEISKEFFMNNKEIVQRSVIPRPLKHMLQRGLV